MKLIDQRSSVAVKRLIRNGLSSYVFALRHKVLELGKMRTHSALLSIFFVLVSSAASAGQISGQINDADGYPVEDAIIRIECEQTIEVKSNEDGYFFATIISVGFCQFRINGVYAPDDYYITRVPSVFDFEIGDDNVPYRN